MSEENTNDDTRTNAGRTRSYAVAGQSIQAPALPGGLYLVATPIGNLADISLRALAVLAAADVIACEDTRISRRLTEHYAIATPLTAYHEHNAAAVRPKLLARLAQGDVIALISDAGTPLISDPGYKLVRAAHEERHLVTVLPGASAVLAALNVAGLPTDRFLFDGFLPPKQSARRARIAELARIPATLVLFETGPRIGDALADLAEGLGERDAAVCRELTKLHEEVRRDSLAELALAYAGDAETRGEFVIVVSPPQEAALASGEELDDLLRRALSHSSVKEAVSDVASATGLPRRDVYRRALELKDIGDGPAR
jgi:16S rRNA (cytidine1402-2'-O)-methyltransferase